MSESSAIAVFITTANKEEAGRLAEMLVEERLSACVQILPEIESIYRWQGKTERQQEVLMIAKTTSARFNALEQRVLAMHSYETPEIVAIPLTDGSESYLNWLRENVEVH
ncbi:MAG TPA: divalent-cation tolerance protein CutA [Pyrinomonadaceae bacterium]|nr:divalent-cation tolerance protein CutA [Pyrinomonadaceae bacterium]